MFRTVQLSSRITTYVFVIAVRREHGLLAVVEAGVVRVVTLYASLHKLLPVSTKHAACHLRKPPQTRVKLNTTVM